MFDFPNTPITGDTATAPNGTVFRWDGVKWIGAGSTQAVASPYGNVGRNLVHNSLFNVAQRGVGIFSTPVAYTLDRWVMNATGDTFTCGQFAGGDAARTQAGDEALVNYFSCSFTGTTGAGANTNLVQRIEGVRRIAGKTVTLSFWARTGNATPKVGVNMAQNFGTGGSPSSGGLIQATGIAFALTPGFTRYSCTFAVPSSAGKTLGTSNNDFTSLIFYFSAGANTNAESGNIGVQASGNIELWGVQLEVGNVATPLEKPDPQVDLANCQRFYTTFAVITLCPVATSINGHAAYVAHPVTMHHTPTYVSQHVAGNVSLGITYNYQSAVGVWTSMAGTPVAGNYEVLSVTASADL